MKLLICALLCVFLIKESHGGVFGLPNPLGIVENVAGKVDEGAKTVAGGVASGVVTGVKGAATVVDAGGHKVIDGSKTVLGKVHNGVFDIENGFVNGVDEVVGTPVDLKEVTFYLVTAKNVDNPTVIDYYKPDDVAQTKGKIYFIIHGWQSSRNASWFHDLSEILIKAHPDTHVVQVNWDRPASDLYPFAAFDTESAGNLVGILVNRLVTEYKIPRENIVLIGHSLGGQISGWAGKKFEEITGRKLPRIIALDPAGPLFILRPDSKRLNKHDAEVVMVIHTDADKLGFPAPCGTIDFFPNGGDSQPGCWTVNLAKVSSYAEPVTCDHSRAWDFFVDAVNETGSFPALKCKSYGDFKKNNCEDVVVAMGSLDTTDEGTYYLQTNEQKPYSKLLQKIVEKIKDGIENIKDDFKKATNETSTGATNPEGSPTNVDRVIPKDTGAQPTEGSTLKSGTEGAVKSL